MKNTSIGKGTKIERAIIAENVKIGNDVSIGFGDERPSGLEPKIYNSGLVTIGENSFVPNNVRIGKNVAISGITVAEDYPNGVLESGEYIIKAGDTR